MGGRGPQTFKKRQKEQQRKERQQEKIAKRLERKQGIRPPEDGDPEAPSADTDVSSAEQTDVPAEERTDVPSEQENVHS